MKFRPVFADKDGDECHVIRRAQYSYVFKDEEPRPTFSFKEMLKRAELFGPVKIMPTATERERIELTIVNLLKAK